MRNLKPEIFRQRLIVEGIFRADVSRQYVESFLKKLSEVLRMHPILEPITFSPTRFHQGFAGFLAWEESGVSIYTWIPQHFFTLDIYSCKPLDTGKTVEFVREFLDCEEIVYQELS